MTDGRDAATPSVEPVPPIVVAHRDGIAGTTPRWGEWYVHAIFATADELSSQVTVAEQYVAYDSFGRRLDLHEMPQRLTVVDNDRARVDLEMLLRRHLRESDNVAAKDDSLTIGELITAVGVDDPPGIMARAGFMAAFICLLVVPWIAGVVLIGWAIVDLF